MTSLHERVKESKLVQWALAYLASAWVLLQVAAFLSSTYGWSPVVLRVTTAIAISGFLAALVVAYYHGERGEQRVRTTEVVLLVAILGIGGGVAWATGRTESSAPSTDSVGSPAVALPARSVAVLPFENTSPDRENEYFSDGITDEVLANLSKVSDLRVISRTSVMGYKETTKNVREIGTELGVGYIVEGSVRREGDRLRIMAQLVNAQTDELLWAETYDHEMRNIFVIQSDIAQKIVVALRARLSPDERSRLNVAPTEDVVAYDYYLKAKGYLYRSAGGRKRAELESAIRLFKEAVALDPGLAAAHAGIGQAYLLYDQYAGADWTDSAEAAIRQAITLDPQLADAYAALGTRAYERGGRFSEAIEHLRRAISLNPNHADAIRELSWIYFSRGRLDEALLWAKRAAALEPTVGDHYDAVGDIYRALGDFTNAEKWYRQWMQIEPDNIGSYGSLASLYRIQGQLDRAAAEVQTLLKLAPTSPYARNHAGAFELERGNLGAARQYLEEAAGLVSRDVPPDERLAYVYWKLGETERAQELLHQLEEQRQREIKRGDEGYRPYVELAEIYAIRGQRDEALLWLQGAIERGWRLVHSARRDPLYESLRSDPRFEHMLAGVAAEVERMQLRVDQDSL